MDKVPVRVSAALLAAATTAAVLTGVHALAVLRSQAPVQVVVMPETVIAAPASSQPPRAVAGDVDRPEHQDQGAARPMARSRLLTPSAGL